MATAESAGREERAASQELALRLAEIADSKGATDIVRIGIGALVSYTDDLVICTARNERMASAIADEVRLRIKREQGRVPLGSDAEASTGWLVMDYLDCVLHIFTVEARDRYQLEDLWRDAPREDLSEVLGAAEPS
jgi:ribosome-associated protein